MGGLTQRRDLAPSAAGGQATPSAAGSAATSAAGAADEVQGENGGATAGRAGDGGGTTTGAGTSSAGQGGEAGQVENLTPPPSCQAGDSTTCNGESCCRALPVPGGSFAMGRSLDGNDAFAFGRDVELPEHPVTVSPFVLDKYEVTVGRFRRFVEAYAGSPPATGTGAHPNLPSSGWQSVWNDHLPADAAALSDRLKCSFTLQTWTERASGNELLPINCVDWFVGYAFCIWDQGRLPTEAEWEFVAAGGSQNRLYPWGSAVPTHDHAVYECAAGGGASDCVSNDIRPVGSRQALGNGRFGHADLAGSMQEHTRDAYHGEFYKQASGTDIVNLDTNLDAFGQSVVRGGDFLSDPTNLRAAARNNPYRSTTYYGIGLRCARDR